MIQENVSGAVAAEAGIATTSACPICKREHTESDAIVLKRLADTPAALAKLVRGLKNVKDFDRSYGPEKWSVRQILCHLRDCEMVFGVRFRKLVSEENVTMVAFEQDLWARHTRYAKQDARGALETFRVLREANLEMLKLAGRASYSRVGNHPEYGMFTIAQLFRHILYHDRNHVAQVEKARSLKTQKGSWK